MRYTTRADGAPPGSAEDTWFTDPLIPSLTVDDSKEVDTGLVDSSGNSIYRLQEPIGFGRDNER